MTDERLEQSLVGGAAEEPPPSPHRALMTALRAVVPRQLCADVAEREIGCALQPVLRAARIGGIPATQVVIAAKHTWAAQPEVRRLDDPVRQAERLERLVALCVEHYYAD